MADSDLDSYVERELKFEVEPGFTLGELAAAVPGGRIQQRSERLRSIYFDTAEHALLGARMTLRHRTGTADNGWQLKIPQPPFREEIRLDAAAGISGAHADARDDGGLPHGSGTEQIPRELVELLLGIHRNRPLVPIATVEVDRSVHELVGADGQTLAELADDTVRASAAGPSAVASTWRELEVELTGGELSLLEQLGRQLTAAGARASRSRSKLARALAGGDEPAESGRPRERVRDVLAGYLDEQRLVILAGDLALRRRDGRVVHRTRVASRRLRSILRTCDVLFEPAAVSRLDAELRWFALLLGEIRDRQVLARRLERLIGRLPDELVMGPVRGRVEVELASELNEHWDALQRELVGVRYLALLAMLEDFSAQPPWQPAADAPAASLRALVGRAERRVGRRLARAAGTADVEHLHAARKAAKRARYTAEAAAPVIGARKSREHAKRYRRLQDLLGEHQDIQLSTALLRRLGASAGTPAGENGFAFGVLYEQERRHGRTATRKARKLVRKYR